VALTENDVCEVQLLGTLLGKPTANVFHLRCTNFVATPAYTLFGSWASGLINLLKPMTSVSMSWQTVRVLNITNDLDMLDIALTGAVGTVSGDSLPSFNAWGFQLTRATRLTDHGHKRFPGVPEAVVSGNAASGAAITQAPLVGAYMTSMKELTGGAGDGEMDVTPVIWGKALPERVTKKGTVLPARAEVFNGITGYLFKGPTSQNSRK